MSRRFVDFVNDDLAVFNTMFNFGAPSFSLLRGEFYNPETHDLVPKKSYQEQQLKLKEKNLEELKRRRENDIRLYEEQEKSLKLEIESLRQKISP